MTLVFATADVALMSGADLPQLATGLGFAVLLIAGVYWVRLAAAPPAARTSLLGMAGGSTGVAFIILGLGWFLPGLV